MKDETTASLLMAKGAKNGMTESDVVMMARNGMYLDQVVLVKTMIMCGLSPPLWRLLDTLPIFEVVIWLISGAVRPRT